MNLEYLISLLPREIIQTILDFFRDKDKINLSTISKFFNRLVLDNTEFK
jgi:hypothetical protein